VFLRREAAASRERSNDQQPAMNRRTSHQTLAIAVATPPFGAGNLLRRSSC
jgi:hypothetical protein